MNRLLLLFIATLCSANAAVAQTAETDSLVALLRNAPNDTNKVHLYWKTGVSMIYQDPFQALPYFKSGIALSEQLSFVSGLEKCNNAASLAFSLNAKYDSALGYINKAVYYAVKAGNIRRLSLAYLNRADVLVNLQNFPAALKDCDTAIVYAQQVQNNDALGRIYSIMVGIYRDLKQSDQALAALDKSDHHFSFTRNRQMVAMNYSERADLLVQSNRAAVALDWYKKAIRIADSLSDFNNLSAYYGSMGEAYAALKDLPRAEDAFVAALNYAKQTGNTGQQAVCYINLGNFEFEKSNFPKSIDYGLKAYELIKPETDTLREQLIANMLAKAYIKNGDTEKAYEFLKLSDALKDSVVKQQFSIETARQQAAFDVKEREREIAVLNKDKELQQQKLQQQRILIFGTAFIALLSLIAIWLLMNRSKLKQQMKELQLRNQIAADLHDEVGSSLSSIHMLSSLASQQGSDTTNKEILTRMSNNARETMDKMGDIVWMIKPGETEAGSLKQRMERFAYEIGEAKNIEMQVEMADLEALKLTMQQRKNIWLIFKEAVNNAAKYSGTRKLEVRVAVQNKQLLLTIQDFGSGFDMLLARKGNGIDNMRNRALDLHGTLVTDTKANQGTSVQLRVPL
jgi:two-component system, NarL family, sensor histidine kinase UhpB